MRSEWHWFVRCDLQIFSGCVCHLEQLHAQSPFLFPIVFSINYIMSLSFFFFGFPHLMFKNTAQLPLSFPNPSLPLSLIPHLTLFPFLSGGFPSFIPLRVSKGIHLPFFFPRLPLSIYSLSFLNCIDTTSELLPKLWPSAGWYRAFGNPESRMISWFSYCS